MYKSLQGSLISGLGAYRVKGIRVPTSFECKYEPKLCPRLGLVPGGLELDVGAA